jgi:multicomponent K+:H+ antiporter subunit E
VKPFRQFLLPSPLLSAALALIWPILNQSWSLGHLFLGALLAVLIPTFTNRLRADRAELHRPAVMLRLLLIVLKDIVTSNIDVARLILGPESAIRPGFFWLPLSISNPHGIVTLAGIITMTPGTLSADLSADRQHLLVHAFNIDDEAVLIASIKSRYEAPLMEIFK